MERRFLRDHYDAADDVAQEMVRLNVDVIVAWAIQLSAAAQRVMTTTIPIVFLAVRGPVERGLVPSLGRPGGNVTGLSTYAIETIDPKLLEVAKNWFHGLAELPSSASSADPPGATTARQKAARALGIELVPIPFSNEKDVSNVPSSIGRSNPQVLIAPDTPLLYSRRAAIVQFAAKSRLPVVYAFREAAEDGGLMALGTDLEDLARHAASHVDKILKGAKPGDLPVEQPTKLHSSSST